MIFVGYIIFGVILFILDLFLSNKYKFNNCEKVIFTIFYMLILAGIFSRIGLINFNKDIFLIVIVELFCELFYSNYILERDVFDNKEKVFSLYFIKLILIFFLNRELINKVKDVFLSGDDLKTVIWLLIIVYMYQFFKDRDVTLKGDEKKISRESIILSFARLKLKYEEDISLSDEKQKIVVYSIMIFNNYKRTKLFRKFDNIIFKINNKPRKLGIMQIMSKKYINDYESIIMACKKIEKLYVKNKNDIEVITLYDKDNSNEICLIYNELKKFCKL